MAKRKHLIRFFAPWNDRKEEHWLEQMASEGWHLVGVSWRYTFEKGTAAHVRYRVDYWNDTPSADEYLTLFRDAGWEQASSFSGSHYFRTASLDAPEIYTDLQSRVEKQQRVLAFALLVLAITFVDNLQWAVRSFSGYRPVALYVVMRGMSLSMMFVWAYVAARMNKYIQQLKGKKTDPAHT